jgi:hypothetical protein
MKEPFRGGQHAFIAGEVFFSYHLYRQLTTFLRKKVIKPFFVIKDQVEHMVHIFDLEKDLFRNSAVMTLGGNANIPAVFTVGMALLGIQQNRGYSDKQNQNND